MRRILSVGVFALLAACAAPRPEPVPSPVRHVATEPAEVKDPNFILIVAESVPNPDDDGISFTKVFVDGKEAGKTAVGRKVEDRTLKLKLPIGNQPIRLEQWVLPGVGEWSRLDDALQPRERFVRVEAGSAEGEASNTLTVSREAAPR
jgi:hypothetical protein